MIVSTYFCGRHKNNFIQRVKLHDKRTKFCKLCGYTASDLIGRDL